jgi:hypothetical protein
MPNHPTTSKWKELYTGEPNLEDIVCDIMPECIQYGDDEDEDPIGDAIVDFLIIFEQIHEAQKLSQ